MDLALVFVEGAVLCKNNLDAMHHKPHVHVCTTLSNACSQEIFNNAIRLVSAFKTKLVHRGATFILSTLRIVLSLADIDYWESVNVTLNMLKGVVMTCTCYVTLLISLQEGRCSFNVILRYRCYDERGIRLAV